MKPTTQSEVFGGGVVVEMSRTLPGLFWGFVRSFSKTVRENSKAFLEFRGTAWMPEPCRSCPQREVDWGGCRCQAFALTGKANVTDPACEKSPDRDVLKLPLQTAQIEAPEFLYRSFSHGGALTSID